MKVFFITLAAGLFMVSASVTAEAQNRKDTGVMAVAGTLALASGALLVKEIVTE